MFFRRNGRVGLRRRPSDLPKQIVQLQTDLAAIRDSAGDVAVLRVQLNAERQVRQEAEARAARHEADMRHDAHAREVRLEAELAQIRQQLNAAAVTEERLRGELRAAAREAELQALLHQAQDGSASRQPTVEEAHTRCTPAPVDAPSLRGGSIESAALSLRGAALMKAPKLGPVDGPVDGPSFGAFISHAKADAAMEARYLQSVLEPDLQARVFLDSDNLRDLRQLAAHVKDSKVLVLLQTRNVLSRPFCLLEILTALDEGVPIIGLALCGCGASGYQFDEATAFLRDFDTRLAEANPGAAATLREHGVVDLAEAAWKLSSSVPNILSMPFNPSASRNTLAAMRADMCDCIANARALRLPKSDEAKLRWLANRAANDSSDTSEASSDARAPSRDVGPVEDNGLAGGALLQAAKVCAELAPLGVMVQAVVRAAGSVVAPPAACAECERLALAAEVLEQELLRADNLKARPELLQSLVAQMDQALGCVVALQNAAKDFSKAETSPTTALLEDLVQVRARLGSIASELELDEFDLSVFQSLSTSADSVKSRRAVLHAELAEQRCGEKVSSGPVHQSLETDRATLLTKQAEQIAATSALSGGETMRPMDFLSLFPMPTGEAERIRAVEDSLLLEAGSPLLEAETAVSFVTQLEVFGKGLLAVALMVMERDSQRLIAFHARLAGRNQAHN